MLKNILLVGLGGGIGSVLRYAASLLINTKYFPYATFTVNIIGCFIIGLVFGLSIRDEAFLNNWKIILASGLCGGFTTFSAFSLESLGLMQSGKFGIALSYISLSIVLGILATFAGYQLIVKNG
ncbi:MAG: fluoride efflux transporter CrcB [Chitinophagaceae bacterium]|nr:fluoride efflux transporter CrcB [Chitinophagaceae bacterium]